MEHNDSDSIYALGSPLGRSALAVVRVSGLHLPEKLYAGLSTTKDKRGFFVRRLSLSGFSETCLVLSFPEPLSYTGESMIEIHPHGNPAVLSELFSWLEGLGIREASPGEFSRRAFLNNKLSLAEAEGIAMGIEAESKEQLLALEDFRGGRLGKKINKILSLIEQLLVRVESQLDFSDEEDVNEVASKEVFSSIKNANKALGFLITEYKPFEKDVMKKTIALTGKPNVGKSSLFQLFGWGEASYCF
jgi:tRNA modification GTPase